MSPERSTAQAAAGALRLPDDAGDFRPSVENATSAEPKPAFAMLGDVGAAACEGDSCSLP